MSTKSEVLKLLEENINTFISGQKLADSLNVSRNSIWKAIKALQKDACPIECNQSLGYKLTDIFYLLSENEIKEHLKYPCRLKVMNQVSSTNTYAKNHYDGKSPLLVVSNEQLSGRGRLGRDFYSPPGTGIYMSYIFKPNFQLNQSMVLTGGCAVAIATAMEHLYKISPKIKWVNDLYIDGKKIGGILTEAMTNIESGEIDSITVGIGINCCTVDFPVFENNIPGSIFENARSINRNIFIAEIINNLVEMVEEFDNEKIIFEYKRRCNTLGKQITIYHEFNNPHEVGEVAKAYDIDSNGGLIVEYLEGPKQATLSTLTSGEISIR